MKAGVVLKRYIFEDYPLGSVFEILKAVIKYGWIVVGKTTSVPWTDYEFGYLLYFIFQISLKKR